MMLISRSQEKLDDVAKSLGECVCIFSHRKKGLSTLFDMIIMVIH